MSEVMWNIPFILLGTGCGVLFFFSPGSVFILVLVLIVCLLAGIFVGREHRRFVLGLFLIGFLMRSALSLGLDGLAFLAVGGAPFHQGQASESAIGVVDNTRGYMLMGDSDYYSQRGYALAQHAKGILKNPSVYYSGEYGWHGYLCVIGAFYYLFGYSPIAVKLFNCLLGALLGPILFFLTKACFNPIIARWVGVAVTFFPSLVLWSATNLKEPSLFLLTALLFFSFTKIRDAKKWLPLTFYIAAFLITFYLHAAMRAAIYPLTLTVCLLVASSLGRPMGRQGKIILALLLLGGLFLVVAYGRLILAKAFVKHVGYVTTPSTVYKYLPQEFYSSDYLSQWGRSGSWNPALLVGIAKAVFHYLLEPFPSRINNLFLSLAYPQMILWYLSLPFAFGGIAEALRINYQRSLFLVLTLLVWTVGGALVSGNVGTVFRIRDMVTPYFLLFSCVGAFVFLKGRSELHQEIGG